MTTNVRFCLSHGPSDDKKKKKKKKKKKCTKYVKITAFHSLHYQGFNSTTQQK